MRGHLLGGACYRLHVPRIQRNEFIDARRTQRLDLNAAKRDPAFLAKLEAAGLTVADLDKLDLANHDGFIEGARELNELFRLLKGVEGGRNADELNVKQRGWSAPADTRADHAFDAFESRFTASPNAAAVPASIDPVRRSRFPLTASVGRGGTNRPADVRLVQQKLKDVGFNIGVDGQFGRNTENALKTYRAMLTGAEYVKDEPGIVGLNDVVDRALSMEQPPRWEKMPQSGPGFVNHDTDGFGYGSAETRKAIEEFSSSYATEYLASNPNAGLISLNDVSERHGGDNHDHDTHENGLDLDLRLPKTDGTSGTDTRRSDYDRNAAWAMLKAIASNPRVERVLFTDPVLLERIKTEAPEWGHKVFDGGRVHLNHFHVDIKPPDVN